jgi:FixJ family two-component response regulator
MDLEPTVFLVDDDASVLESLTLLMRSVGLRTQTFASAGAFLDTYNDARPGCLVLDVRMPGMSGPELQQALAARGSSLPIVFLTAHGDIPLAVDAIKAGAVDFIQKPFRDQDLLDVVQRALREHVRTRGARVERERIAARLATLTSREREVMEMVVDGRTNKVIARDLGISQRTVEIHRARVMQKMEAESVSELVRLALQLKR